MAEAIVSVLNEQLGSIIQQELEQEVRLVVGVGKEVANLTTTLSIIKPVLEDAEEKQLRNEAVKFWLRELKDILYDADDVLDEWNTKNFIARHVRGVISYRSSNAKKVLSYMFSPCSCFRPVKTDCDNASRIKTIREKIDVLALNKDQFNLVESKTCENTRQIISFVVNVSKIYGRDLDKGIILSKLVGETSSREMHVSVPVICIVGMGGLGKTALAQLVFEEETLITTFQLKMWVCVSEHYDFNRIAKEIIVQATGQMPDDVGWEDLRKSLWNTIKGKQFLLVLDNVWTEDYYKDWNPLKLCLDAGALGSRILVTTRNEEVAKMMDSIYTHRLGLLSDKDCWSLLRHRICLKRSAEELGKFEDIGKEIAKKCKGVPLAAKMLASLLWFKRTKQDWKNVLASEIWVVQQLQIILPALLLSYCALPSYLKRCFMYCAIFPKDAKLYKDNLVKLWMAQGFLGYDGGKELEMIGRDYFDDLATRSFFQDFVEDGDGNITACKMHDLVHDLSQFLTTTESLSVARFSSNKASPIHASDSNKSPCIDKATNLRTLIIKSTTVALPELFHQQTCLRALDLSRSDLKELPREVDRLIHLRLLDLSCTRLKDLPETVNNLYNLQTLKLNHCRHLCNLPEHIGDLLNLRHIEIEGTYALNFIPKGIGRLSRIQTLCKFIIGGANAGCTMTELRILNFLTGYLEIIGLRQVKSVNDAKQAELQNKKNICSLKLNFDCIWQGNENLREDNIRKMEAVLESLQPHKNLENLRIVGYPGSVFPSWISRNVALSNIVTLKLFRCKLCTQLPTLGELESLESLTIENLESVKHIGPEFYGTGVESNDDSENEIIAFPKLKKLEFVDMEVWEDWQFPFSKYKQIMPRLCYLTLKSCPKLVGLPSVGKLESLESMYIWGLSSLKRVGLEFFGISDDKFYKTGSGASAQQKIIFPKLKDLKFAHMEEFEEWKLPFQMDTQIMPHLRSLELRCCGKLKVLPALGSLQSLETLKLHDLRVVEHLGAEFLGISDCDVENKELTPTVVFSRLMYLTLEIMPEWEEHNDIVGKSTAAAIMPSLHTLEIAWCRKLKAVPPYMVPHTLKYLYLTDCPQLTGMQPYLPQLLEELILDRDVGVFSRSLPINSSNSYPNLKYFAIHSSPCTSLPQGFEKLTSLQELHIFFCKIIDFKTEELEHLASLRKLEISDCPILTERCKEDWSILSHVPVIITDFNLGG
ncbi:hypothetical protein AQUCO_01400253v1 [Aquilegia coerulea]|uniref:NB-ARC domain-containing protein n=1 Tax=Aquilegia coerulea TaxID=218851 RepID=A0A2G5DVC4_AQUCA|nr:hypothetical protein AQUCO_01400253v1 [Aquilegia coerulea]